MKKHIWSFKFKLTQQSDSPAVRTPPSSPGPPYSTTATESSGCSEAALLPRKRWRDGEHAATPDFSSGSRQADRHHWKQRRVSVDASSTACWFQTWRVTCDFWPLCLRWVTEISLNVLHVLQVCPGEAIKHLPLVGQVEVNTAALVYTKRDEKIQLEKHKNWKY